MTAIDIQMLRQRVQDVKDEASTNRRRLLRRIETLEGQNIAANMSRGQIEKSARHLLDRIQKLEAERDSKSR